MDVVIQAVIALLGAGVGAGITWACAKWQIVGYVQPLVFKAIVAVEATIPDDATGIQGKIDAILKAYIAMRTGKVTDAEIAKVKAIITEKVAG